MNRQRLLQRVEGGEFVERIERWLVETRFVENLGRGAGEHGQRGRLRWPAGP